MHAELKKLPLKDQSVEEALAGTDTHLLLTVCDACQKNIFAKFVPPLRRGNIFFVKFILDP